MLSEREKKFVDYWESCRDKEKQWQRQFVQGLPIGLLFALPILAILFTGKYWYKRADAVAHAKLNPSVLVIAVLIITIFIAFFYKRYQWEMRDQLYRELKNKKKGIPGDN